MALTFTLLSFLHQGLFFTNSSVSLSKEDNNKIVTNTGTTNDIEITLPNTITPGNHLRIVVTENQWIKIYPDNGDQFRNGQEFYESSIPGSSIEFYSVVNGIWEVNIIEGSW